MHRMVVVVAVVLGVALSIVAVPALAGGCSGSACRAAVGATRKIARDVYKADNDARSYSARCSRSTATRFVCTATVRGVLSHQVVGKGKSYHCDYSVTAHVRKGVATARFTGGITGYGPKSCVRP